MVILTVRLLESLGREGSICVYSDYERSVIGRLPEPLPSLSYGDLEVQDDEIAARAYYRMLFEETDLI